MTEKEFDNQIVQLAKLYGWLTYHTYRSVRSEPGFPDRVLVKDRVIFAELKVPGNKLTEHQAEWRRKLLEAGAEYYIWYPSDWDEIQTVLTGSRRLK